MKTRQKQFEKNLCSTLRTVETSNRFLLAQADKKARILIQVNVLLTTVLLILTVYIAPAHRWFLLPVGIQLLSSVIVIATSLLVTKPRFFVSHVITHLVNSQKTSDGRLLAEASLYWNLLRDAHGQATVLAVKYKCLRLSYHVFMAGLFLSLSATLVVVAITRLT
jgi:hypothetical protein